MTKEEIDTISGGGVFGAIGNFFKDHWKAILIGTAIVVSAEVCLADIGGENDLMTYIVAWSSVSQGTFFISKIAAKILAYLRQ